MDGLMIHDGVKIHGDDVKTNMTVGISNALMGLTSKNIFFEILFLSRFTAA